MRRLRLLIVDDHAMFRDGLRAVLEHADDMELVGEAGDGETAITLAAELQPDIVLMDLHMPGLGGIEATRIITAAHPRIKIIALSMYQDDRLINEHGRRWRARVHPEGCARDRTVAGHPHRRGRRRSPRSCGTLTRARSSSGVWRKRRPTVRRWSWASAKSRSCRGWPRA